MVPNHTTPEHNSVIYVDILQRTSYRVILFGPYQLV